MRGSKSREKMGVQVRDECIFRLPGILVFKRVAFFLLPTNLYTGTFKTPRAHLPCYIVPIKTQRVSIFLPSRTATNILLFLVPQASPSSPSPSQSGHRCISYCYSCGCRGFKASDHTPRPPHLTMRHHASAHYIHSSVLHHSTPHCTSQDRTTLQHSTAKHSILYIIHHTTLPTHHPTIPVKHLNRTMKIMKYLTIPVGYTT